MSKIIPGLDQPAFNSNLFINAQLTDATDKCNGSGPWDILQCAVDEFIELAEPGFLALAAVGILSMALIETLKHFYSWRRSFQQSAFIELLDKRASEQKEIEPLQEDEGENLSPKWDSKKAFEEIVKLATAGNADALFDLPIDRFSGQVNAAMQMAISYPYIYSDMIRAMAHGAGKNDIRILCKEPQDPEASPQELKKYSDARNRVAGMAQRSLDAIQIDFGNRWAKDQHRLSVLLSVVIIAGSALWYHNGLDNPIGPRVVAFWIIIAIVGGMVAPVAKDIVTALKRIKDRPR